MPGSPRVLCGGVVGRSLHRVRHEGSVMQDVLLRTLLLVHWLATHFYYSLQHSYRFLLLSYLTRLWNRLNGILHVVYSTCTNLITIKPRNYIIKKISSDSEQVRKMQKSRLCKGSDSPYAGERLTVASTNTISTLIKLFCESDWFWISSPHSIQGFMTQC